MYSELEEKEINKQVNEITQAHVTQQHSKAWKLINEITGRKSTPTGKIRAKSQEERKNLWFQHFSELLGESSTEEEERENEEEEEIENIFENVDIYDGAFTMDEYKAAVKACKEGKAPGEDGIVPEILKRCDFDEIMLGYCNRLHTQGEKPEQWGINNIKPLPKKGDLGITKNYRGIFLSPLITKICNKMILNRIRPKIDPKLRSNQNGFREGRTTTGQILALRRLIEGIREKNLSAVLTLIDFSKAFDSIDRRKMFKILKAYGVPPKLLNTIKVLYTNTRARVISPDGETDLFEIAKGVLQGDTLAPFLFVIVLDYAMRKAIEGREELFGFTITPRKSRRVPAKVITDLDFADDIALTSNRINQAQDLLLAVEAECKKVGLEINAGKTQFMSYNITDNIELWIANGTKIRRAIVEKTKKQDFKYLGAWVDTTYQDIRIRKALAWSALNKMDKIWKSNLSKTSRINLFRATVESVLLYGCETWTLTKKINKTLDGCYTRMLRKVNNVTWKDHFTNKALYGDLQPISSVIRRRRLKFSGHCVRSQDPVSELVLWEPKHGKRRSGRPEKTYINILKEDTGMASTHELETCMKDREVWQRIVSRCSTMSIDR